MIMLSMIVALNQFSSHPSHPMFPLRFAPPPTPEKQIWPQIMSAVESLQRCLQKCRFQGDYVGKQTTATPELDLHNTTYQSIH